MTANYKRIYSFALALVADPNDADDVKQEASRGLWEKFDEFDLESVDSSFAAWAMAVTRHVAMRNNRAAGKRRMLAVSDEVFHQIADAAVEVNDEHESRRAALARCLDQLADEHKQLIYWRYDRQERGQQIADRLGVSPQAVYRSPSRIHGSLLRCIRHSLGEDAQP